MSIWGAQFGRQALSAFAKAARRAMVAYFRFIEAFLNLMADAGVRLGWWIYVLLFLAVAIVASSTLVLTEEFTGGSEHGVSVLFTPLPGTPTAAATGTPAAALPPTATPPAVPRTITLRGTLDESVYESSELGSILKVVENSIMLVLPTDGGPIDGSARIRIDNFPIGSAIEQLYEGFGGSPADYPNLENCMSLVTLHADAILGTYSPQSSSIEGSTYWVGEVEDRPCLSPLPGNITMDEVVPPAAATFTATFDGHQAAGVFSGESGQQSFQATVQ